MAGAIIVLKDLFLREEVFLLFSRFLIGAKKADRTPIERIAARKNPRLGKIDHQ
jgi:hypothetical protein